MPDTCIQDYRHQQRGLDAKLNSPLQSAEKLFLLTSPFIEPSPPEGRGLSLSHSNVSVFSLFISLQMYKLQTQADEHVKKSILGMLFTR